MARLESLDSHMISKAYKKCLWIPYIFAPRATVDAIFVPWLWADVNMAESGNNFRSGA